MKSPGRSVLLGFVLILAVDIGQAAELVVQKEISVSRTLGGHALVRGTSESLIGVTVELCSSDWKTVLASTKTNENGYLSLEKPVTGKLFYVRLSAHGMDIYQLRVRVKRQAAAPELTVY